MLAALRDLARRRPVVSLAFLASLIFLVVSFLAAILFLWSNNWFGAGDLRVHLPASLPLAAVLFLVSMLFTNATRQWRAVYRSLLAVPLALLVTFVITLCVGYVLAPWFSAFSYPVFFCWLIGALAGLVASVAIQSPQPLWGHAAVLALGLAAVLLLYSAATAPDPGLIIVFKPGVGQWQINEFWDEHICLPNENGCRLLDELSRAQDYSDGNRPAVLINFRKGTPARRIEEIRGIMQASSLVREIRDYPEDK